MRLAVVGATGAVGETILRVLEERAVAVESLGAFASRDRTEPVRFCGGDVPVREATLPALAEYDAVLFAGGEDASSAFAEPLAGQGIAIIDNSATFRLSASAPLCVPEINGDSVDVAERIFPVANCTAIVVCMALAPIERAAGLAGIRLATYQAVSGAGRAGLEELAAGERALQAGTAEAQPLAFARAIARNVVPQVGSFDEAGESSEEKKIAAETRKILGLPNLRVAATAVRVPVRTAHSAAVFLETIRESDVRELGQALASAPGVVYHPAGIITPREVEGSDLVHVARLRAEEGSGRHFALWVVGDQLRKGAATNAVQILELLAARGAIRVTQRV